MVHRDESLLHEELLQVLIVHRDFSHHVTWHKTGETTRLPVIETIIVFVSIHLTNTETVVVFVFESLTHVYICLLKQQTVGEKVDKSH